MKMKTYLFICFILAGCSGQPKHTAESTGNTYLLMGADLKNQKISCIYLQNVDINIDQKICTSSIKNKVYFKPIPSGHYFLSRLVSESSIITYNQPDKLLTLTKGRINYAGDILKFFDKNGNERYVHEHSINTIQKASESFNTIFTNTKNISISKNLTTANMKIARTKKQLGKRGQIFFNTMSNRGDPSVTNATNKIPLPASQSSTVD